MEFKWKRTYFSQHSIFFEKDRTFFQQDPMFFSRLASKKGRFQAAFQGSSTLLVQMYNTGERKANVN